MNDFSNGFCPSGTYCNSASACFVASDGRNLRLYQAVVDARKLLDELSDPETSVSEQYRKNKVCNWTKPESDIPLRSHVWCTFIDFS